jgi:hypothetical protein
MRKRHWAPKAVLAASAAALGAGGFLASPASAQTLNPTTTPVVPQITTVAGTPQMQGSAGDGGVAVNIATLSVPNGVAVSAQSGTLYISDSGNNKIRRVVSPTIPNQDIISTYAGTGTPGYSGDGGQAVSAQLNNPSGVALDGNGDLFIADKGNNLVREVSPTGQITRVAGKLVNGQPVQCGPTVSPSGIGNGGSALSAQLCSPTGVAVMGGVLYIADTGNNQVRKVTLSSGTIIDFAGTGAPGNSGDGGMGPNAKLSMPTGLAIDGENVYIADTGNNRVRVEVANNMKISAFAGTGAQGHGGDGGKATSATLWSPTGVGVDSTGNVYIADTGNNKIRKVAGGIITTFAGTGDPGGANCCGIGPAISAKLLIPTGSVAASGGVVFFSDTGNQIVRGVFNGPPPALPESTLVVLLPTSGGLVLLGAGGYLFLRRRRHPAVASV